MPSEARPVGPKDTTAAHQAQGPWRVYGEQALVNWELSAAPYLPIYRRRLWRRRIFIAAILLAIVVPSFVYYRHLAAESMGRRVFDDVESSVAAAYYDPSYHGLA